LGFHFYFIVKFSVEILPNIISARTFQQGLSNASDEILGTIVFSIYPIIFFWFILPKAKESKAKEKKV
jgi:hypothetical protein